MSHSDTVPVSLSVISASNFETIRYELEQAV
jgi:hypothetical protein